MANDYRVTDDLQKRFFKNPRFCTSVQDYIRKTLSVEIEISLATVPKQYRYESDKTFYKIQQLGTHTHPSLSDLITNYLNKIRSVTCSNLSMKWFSWFLRGEVPSKFLQKLINQQVTDLFTIISIDRGEMKLYYLPRDPSSDANGEKLESFLQNEISQATISLPLPHERSPQLETEFKQFQAEESENDQVLIVFGSLTVKTKQKEIVLFGYDRKVIELKKKVLHIIERNTITTYKLPPIDEFLVSPFSLSFHQHEYSDQIEHLLR